MRHGVLAKRVMEGRFVMLLANSKGCRIGGKCGEGGGVAGGVGKAVGRGIREGVEGDFGREAISAHENGFFGVEAGEVGGVGGVAVAEGAVGGEVGRVAGVAIGAVAEGFFACFVRTCSCSLVLLPNFSGHRLQANASAFSFAIRASSAARFSAMRASSI